MKSVIAAFVAALFSLTTFAVPVSAGRGSIGSDTAAYVLMKRAGKRPAPNIQMLKPTVTAPKASTSRPGQRRAASGQKAPRPSSPRPKSAAVRDNKQRSASRPAVQRQGAGGTSGRMQPSPGRRGNTRQPVASTSGTAPARPSAVAITGSHANAGTRSALRQSGDFGSGFRRDSPVRPAAATQTARQAAPRTTRRGKGFRVRFRGHK